MLQANAIRCWAGLDELRPVLEGHLARRCRDASEVDDVVQETLLRAARYRASLADPGRLRAWALRIALNVLRDHVRRESRLPRAEASEEALDAVEGREAVPDETQEEDLALGGVWIERETALAELAAALRDLRREDRAVLRSYYGGRQSCRETALHCGIAPDLVKVRLFRARKRLLRALQGRLAIVDRDGGHNGGRKISAVRTVRAAGNGHEPSARCARAGGRT